MSAWTSGVAPVEWWDKSWEDIEAENHRRVTGRVPIERPDPAEYDDRPPATTYRACGGCGRRMDRGEPLYAQGCGVFCATDLVNRSRTGRGEHPLTHAQVAARFDLPWTPMEASA